MRIISTGQPDATSTYGSSAVKRSRRTFAEVDALLEAAKSVIDGAENRITIRHLFYRLVSLRVIQKTEDSYRSLTRHLGKWRRQGKIEWDSFVDGTRWHCGDESFDGLQDALQNTVDCYRRNLWATQRSYVEIWAEKDAIASIIVDEANSFGVKTFICRGFASLTSLYSAAQTFKAAQQIGKFVHIYYFGDHDPSGVCMDQNIVSTLADDFNVNVAWHRAAVRPDQIIEWNLPTRPPKKTDSRSKNWDGECVEIDAVDPSTLKGLVRDSITEHINPGEWQQLKQQEELERETLRGILGDLK